MQITSLNHKYFRTHVEDSLSLGRPLLIEDVGEELDPALDNLLNKNFIRTGTAEKVMIGDKDCDVMAGFVLYLTTKLPNPAYSPEVRSKSSFHVTHVDIICQHPFPFEHHHHHFGNNYYNGHSYLKKLSLDYH